jgi:hypothetical protein
MPGTRRVELPEDDAPQELPTVTVEFVGMPPYGREFVTSHTIERSSGKIGTASERKSFAGQGIEVPQDLVWDASNGYKVKVDASLVDLIEGLRSQEFLKVHE